MKKTKRMKKALGGGLLAAALAFSVALPGAAFAIGGKSSDKNMGASWSIPTTPMTNTVEKNGTQYKVVTTWAMAWSTSGPDFLGINNSSFYGNGGNGNANVTDSGTGATQTLLGIWASEANEEPDAFNWNSFYNLYAKEQTAAGTAMSETDLACTTDSWDSTSGVFGSFKYRPEIIWLCNNLSDEQTAGYVSLINNGNYVTNVTQVSGDDADEITPDEWKKLPIAEQTNYTPDNANKPTKYTRAYSTELSTGASEAAEFYVEGDETYNPYVIQPVNSSPYCFVDSAYELANLADKVVADTANNKGLANGEQLSWKTMNKLPRSTRYSESAYDCALNIERLARGSVYYTLSKIADNLVQRKKVAFVDSTPSATDTTHVTVQVYDYIESIADPYGNANMHGRASWSPLVVDQLGAVDGDNLSYAEKGDHTIPTSNASTGAETDITRPTMTVSRYVASADDLLTCDVIYAANQSYTVDQWKTFLQGATDDSKSSKIDQIDIITTTPYVCNGSNYTMDKMIYGAFAMDCFYPELFPNMENSTFWYNKIYHIKNDALGQAMAWSFGSATLPAKANGLLTEEGAKSYSADTTIAKYNEGLTYYNDKKTTDATISRILANKALDGSAQTSDGTAYNYSNFEPSSYWASSTKITSNVWTASSVAEEKATSQEITVSSASISMTVGDSAVNLGASAKGNLTYSSSNEAVAIVDANGNVTAVAPGNAVITVNAAASGIYTAASTQVNVTVAAKPTPKADPVAQAISGTAKFSKKFGDKAFSLGASAKTALSYKSSNTKVATVSNDGKVTIKGAGSVNITITAKATDAYKAATKTVAVSVAKASQTISAKNVSKTLKAKKGKLAKNTVVAVKSLAKVSAKTTVKYAKSGKWNSKIALNTTSGKITAKKGLKKGTYKLKVKLNAAASANYAKAKAKTITVTLKVR